MMQKLQTAAKGANKSSKFLSAIGKAAGKSLEPLTSFAKGLGTIASRFKRILMYRAVRKVISEIGKAFKEGVKNVYQWSAATGGQLAASMDDATASMNYLKNSIGAAAAPIINVLAPAIHVVTDAVVGLINVVNQLLALLGGQSSWTRAIRNTDNYADAVSGAGGAAKEALRYLAPFDELNVLPKESGGGGGGGSAVDYSSMFEETTEFAQGIADFAQSIRDAVNAGDWQGLGELLGNKVNEIVGMIDWSGIGTSIGQKINAFFTTKYWTLETINFQNLGARIADLLSSMLNNIDFEYIGRGFVQGFTILPSMLIGFLGNLDWAAVGRSIGDYVTGAFSQAAEWIRSVDWGDAVTGLIQGLWTAIRAIDWGELAVAVTESVVAVFGGVTDIIGQITTDIIDAWHNAPWDGLKIWLKDVVWGGLKQFFIDGANDFSGGINGILDSIAQAFGAEESAVHIPLIPDLDPPPGEAYASWKSQFEASSRNNPAQVSGELTDIIMGSGGGGGFSLQGGKLRLETMAYFTEYTNGIKNGVDGGGRPFIDSSAKFVKWDYAFASGQITSAHRPFIDSSAKFYTWDYAFASGNINGQNRPFINSSAKFYTWDYAFTDGQITSKHRPFINSSAKFYTYERQFESNTDGSGNPMINSTANFNNRKDNIGTIFDSTANFNRRTDNISTTFNSTANIVSQNIAVAKMDGYMKIDSTANIVKTSGINHVNLNATAYITQTKQESGGVLKNGKWNPIQSYASGGSPFGGQIFRARENGNPELVGTLHGSTAVMNNDQIVASVSAGVAKAIAGIRFQMTGGGGTDTEQMMYSAFSRALAENNEEITLDGDVVYNKMLSRNRRETYRTGVNPMAAMA